MKNSKQVEIGTLSIGDRAKSRYGKELLIVAKSADEVTVEVLCTQEQIKVPYDFTCIGSPMVEKLNTYAQDQNDQELIVKW